MGDAPVFSKSIFFITVVFRFKQGYHLSNSPKSDSFKLILKLSISVLEVEIFTFKHGSIFR